MESVPNNYYENKNLRNNSNISNEENSKQTQKYKTELCKTFQSTRKCPYGHKCLFAHGENELIIKRQSQNYKKKPCKNFNEKGFCLYGTRCNFMHTEKKINNMILSYYYFRLIIHKNFGFFENSNFSTPLLNGRLQIFEKITNEKSGPKKTQISRFTKFFNKESSSSVNSNSNEESDGNYNDSNYNNVNIGNINNITSTKNNRFNNLVNDNLFKLDYRFVINHSKIYA